MPLPNVWYVSLDDFLLLGDVCARAQLAQSPARRTSGSSSQVLPSKGTPFRHHLLRNQNKPYWLGLISVIWLGLLNEFVFLLEVYVVQVC